VLLPDNLLNILARYVHLQIEEVEDWQGKKSKKESMIFPRYHQWDVVSRLLGAARSEGAGHKYLIQHSAGSGKSNSIACTAHQLSSLYDLRGIKQFHSVIVVTDRTVLDGQLQDTIHSRYWKKILRLRNSNLCAGKVFPAAEIEISAPKKFPD